MKTLIKFCSNVVKVCHEDVWRNGGIAPHIPNLGNYMEVSYQLYTMVTLCVVKEALVITGQGAELLWTQWQRQNILPLPGTEPVILPRASNLVVLAIITVKLQPNTIHIQPNLQ
jgi:hypothetical protein